ncbi:MAG: arylsulfotransferase family protein [Acidimicrobiales bacterium]
MTEHRFNRRQLLGMGAKTGAGVVAAGAIGYVGHIFPSSSPAAGGTYASTGSTSTTSPPSSTSAKKPAGADTVDHFASRPDLQPPRVSVTRRAGAFRPSAGAPRYVFVSPKGYQTDGPGQQGLMMLDTAGNLVWFLPLVGSSSAPFDLQVQTYRGKPVLTWWQGKVLAGYGEGLCHLADSSYRQIATVQAGNGLKADLHELNLTPEGTALITAYRTADADLSALGGPAKGQVFACQAQEVDVATGKLLFSWDSLDHVPVTETYAKLPTGKSKGPFDYFHINSVSLAPDGDLLISARNTWTIYKVSRSTGKIAWRLNGKKSDFAMGKGTNFYWQHHARAHPGGELSLFDDGASPPEEVQSRGIVLRLDTKAGQPATAQLVRQYTHPAKLLADNQGSMQLLGDGRVFVGWGDEPYFSEFTKDGTLVLDGRFPADDQSYRAFTSDWTGHPTESPALAVEGDTTGGTTVYASWNGATELSSWVVLSGKSPSNLTAAGRSRRVGFETVISVVSSDKWFAVAALDRQGKEIGRSKPVQRK